MKPRASLEPHALPRPSYTVWQVAQLLGKTNKTIHEYIHKRIIRAFKYSAYWRIPVEGLEEFLAKSYLTPEMHLELEKIINRAFAVLEKVIALHPLASKYFTAFDRIGAKLDGICKELRDISGHLRGQGRSDSSSGS